MFEWFDRRDAVTSASPSLHMVRMPSFVLNSARVLFVIIVLLATSLLFVPWVQTSVATGKVIAYDPVEREQTLESPINGQVVKWHVIEGEVVEEGQVLVDLGDTDPAYVEQLNEQLEAIAARQRAARESITQYDNQLESMREVRDLTMDAMQAKLAMANNEVEVAKLDLQGKQGALVAAEKNLTRKEQLAEEGLSSQREFEVAQMKEIKARADVASARAKLQKERSKVLSIKAERESKRAELQAKLADISSKRQDAESKLAKENEARSKIEVQLSRQAQMIVRAPRAGRIGDVIAFQGNEIVKQGDPLATIVPETETRAVEIFISGLDAALMHEGREVRLQFEGWPAIQFSGWPSAAVGTFGGVVAFVDSRARPDGSFRVVVLPNPDEEPWPPSKYLRQGTRANGWVLLNEVPLGYELWRQFNGFPPQLNPDGTSALPANLHEKTKAKK